MLAGFLASAPVLADPFEMDVLETDDLQLLYFDPFQTYLTPLVARTFYNSLQFQRRVFEWTPYEKSTVLLTDFADYGNAGAGASPRNGVTLYIAPPSHTLETLPGSERMYSTMNHEAVHLANMDVANSRDLRWRQFFGGKPRQTEEHPESILYNYLTVPRLSVPRWYLEGAASFMETWMAGGIGRAQGAYDEMVFRAMVRDDAHFYSNLGLVSKGVAADFQTGTNAYLYGTRFFSYLADVYSPQAVVEWLKRGEDSEPYYAEQFAKVFGKPLETAWNEWIAWEHEFQAANLQVGPAVPTDARPAPDPPGARFRLALLLRPRDQIPDRRLPVSRRRRLCRRRFARRRQHPQARRHQGTDEIPGDVDGLRSGHPDVVLLRRQQRLAGPDGGGRRLGRGAHAARGRAHRRPLL